VVWGAEGHGSVFGFRLVHNWFWFEGFILKTAVTTTKHTKYANEEGLMDFLPVTQRARWLTSANGSPFVSFAVSRFIRW
jgi:hypothetical protein